MPNLFRLTIRLVIIFIVITVAAQPYNWYCQLTQNCQPFYWSYYIPKTEGTQPINVEMEITSYREDLEFRVENPSLTTVSNRKNIAIYHMKNLSDHPISVRPKLQIEPANLEKYITRYECLCFHEYKLKKGEEITLKMRFEIKEEIYRDSTFNEAGSRVKIRYRVK